MNRQPLFNQFISPLREINEVATAARWLLTPAHERGECPPYTTWIGLHPEVLRFGFVGVAAVPLAFHSAELRNDFRSLRFEIYQGYGGSKFITRRGEGCCWSEVDPTERLEIISDPKHRRLYDAATALELRVHENPMKWIGSNRQMVRRYDSTTNAIAEFVSAGDAVQPGFAEKFQQPSFYAVRLPESRMQPNEALAVPVPLITTPPWFLARAR